MSTYTDVKAVVTAAGYAVEPGDLCGLACYPSAGFTVYVADPVDSAEESLSEVPGWTVTVTDYDTIDVPDTTYEVATIPDGSIVAVLAATLAALSAPTAAAAAVAMKGA